MRSAVCESTIAQFIAIASKYGIVNYSSYVKAAIWRSFIVLLYFSCDYCRVFLFLAFIVHIAHSLGGTQTSRGLSITCVRRSTAI